MVTTNAETSGQAIERLSRRDGRTKWWVAQNIGVHPSHLSKLISGERRITQQHASDLAALFNVPIETFLPPEKREGGES